MDVSHHILHQGCSVRFFGSKGLIQFVKVLEPSNCSSSLMSNFENGGLLVPVVILVQNMPKFS